MRRCWMTGVKMRIWMRIWINWMFVGVVVCCFGVWWGLEDLFFIRLVCYFLLGLSEFGF